MKHTVVSLVFGLVLAVLIFYPGITFPFWGYILLVLLYLGIVGIGSGFIWSQYHLKAHLGNPSVRPKVIALSFDDGPTEFTNQVLDVLERYDAKATFFCIGKQLEKYPQIAERLVQSGHIIGNHSYSHSTTFDFYSSDRVSDELEKTNRLIFEICHKKARFFRPPYGVTNPAIAKAVKKGNFEVIGWSLRSNDGISHDVEAIFRRIENGLKPGKIVLMHDTSESSVEVLERLLLLLKRENYRVVLLHDLLELKPYAL